MANIALTALENALRERKLDCTLTTALPPLERSDPAAFIPFDIASVDTLLGGRTLGGRTLGDRVLGDRVLGDRVLGDRALGDRALGDRALGGGLPRGQVSELAGPHSSGRTTLLLHLIGAATRGGEIAALVDTCDRFDVASASAAGIDLDRLLWIRGEPFDSLRSLRASPVVDRAIKALNLVLQAGGFAVVAIDLADIPPRVLKSLPFTTWLRLQRIVEGSDIACLLVTPEPLARSAGGLTVMCTGQTTWNGQTARGQTARDATARARVTAVASTASAEAPAVRAEAVRLTGLETGIRVVSPRWRVDGEARVAAVANDSD
jgi:hypothetical protein